MLQFVAQALDFLGRRRRGVTETWPFTPEGVGAVEREDMQVDDFWAQGSRVVLAYELRWSIDTVAGRRSGTNGFCGDPVSGLVYAPALDYEVLRSTG